jgi:hypothetical protein
MDDQPTTRYFVCEDCAHQWNAPEMPDRCENCRREPACIAECADAEDQDDFSESVRVAHLDDQDDPDA